MTSLVLAGVLFGFFPAAPLCAEDDFFNPHYLISDSEMTNVAAMGRDELARFLTIGYLGRLETTDYLGTRKSASDIIWDEANRYQINPQFILATLQKEQSLVQDQNPTQDQLDWAMGYAVCDSCAKNDPAIQAYRGFGRQVHYAAEKIRESYLRDIAEKGTTISGFGPNVRTAVDGALVIPMNSATSVLYTYTPHLAGNQSFMRIWNKWFRRNYPTGSLLQNEEDYSLWLIQDGTRRPITSRTAFYSRYNPEGVIKVKTEELDAYEIGAPISYPNYSLLKTPDNTVYLLVDDTKRAIASWEAFRAIGFNADEIMEATEMDLAPYHEGPLITVDSTNPQGVLLKNPENGGIFYVSEGKKSPIMSKQILQSQFPDWPINSATMQVLESYATSEPVKFPDGTLVAAEGSPDIFAIADGQRRHILDENTFLTYGYKWENVVRTNERAVLIHPLGPELNLKVEEELGLASQE
jgi:hypothetical protein